MLVFGAVALVLLLFLLLKSRRRFGSPSRFRWRLPGARPQPRGERRTVLPVVARAAAPDVVDALPIVLEPSARAFPVQGLSAGAAAAWALQTTLRRLSGVSRAYVSPVTALAYVSFLPDEVSEQQLVDAIRGDGYGVDDAAHRFDWRHAVQA